MITNISLLVKLTFKTTFVWLVCCNKDDKRSLKKWPRHRFNFNTCPTRTDEFANRLNTYNNIVANLSTNFTFYLGIGGADLWVVWSRRNPYKLGGKKTKNSGIFLVFCVDYFQQHRLVLRHAGWLRWANPLDNAGSFIGAWNQLTENLDEQLPLLSLPTSGSFFMRVHTRQTSKTRIYFFFSGLLACSVYKHESKLWVSSVNLLGQQGIFKTVFKFFPVVAHDDPADQERCPT